VPESVHSFARHSDIGEVSPFGELSQKLREWMGNMVSVNQFIFYFQNYAMIAAVGHKMELSTFALLDCSASMASPSPLILILGLLFHCDPTSLLLTCIWSLPCIVQAFFTDLLTSFSLEVSLIN